MPIDPLPPPADLASAVLADAPAALLHAGADGVLRRANPAALALLGAAAEPGQPLADLWQGDADTSALRGPRPATAELPLRQPTPAAQWVHAERSACVHPDDRAAIEALFRPAIAEGRPYEHQFRVVWPDARVRWLASGSVELHDETTGERQRIGVNWDVTDSRTAEAARHEREIALRESAAKSKFLARMSHELRTPLNAVLGCSQLLLTEETGGDAGTLARRRRLDPIRAAGQHLLRLIDDVLDLASLKGGEVRIELQPVALAPLVAETLPLLAPLLASRPVTLRSGHLDVQTMADATRLRQLLLNLLSNAIKYNRTGGEISIDAEMKHEGVVLRVADSGRGMTPEQLQHLFEPFNRLGVEGDSIEGTGIGLAIVKSLVDRMGGSV